MNRQNRTYVEGSVGWCEQLVRAYEDRRDEVVGKSWAAIDDLYHRRVFSDNRMDPDDLLSHCVEPPRVNQITNLIVSTLFNRRPKLFVQPTTVDYEEIADAMTTVANNDWNRDYSMVRQCKLCVQDAAQKGMGIMYTIPEQDFGAASKERRRRLKATKKLQQSVMLGIADEEPRTIPGGLPWAETGSENDDLWRMGRVGSGRIDPRRVFFDWTAGSENSLGFVGRSYYTTPAKVALQKHWNEAAKSRIKFGKLDEDDFLQSVDGDPYERALIREGWFRTPEGKFELKIWWDGADPEDGFLYEDPAPLEYGHPFRFLRWSDTGSMMWAPSDILTVYQAIVMERHLLTRWYDAMMRQGVDINLVNAELITEDQLSPVEVEGVGMLIRLSNLGDKKIDDVFKRLGHDSVSPEVLQYLALIERHIQDGLGLGVNQTGQYGKSETSATEAQAVKEYSDVRWAPRHAAMEEFIAGIGHDRLRQYIQFDNGGELLAALAGPDAAKVLTDAHLTAGDVQWGLHVQVVPGSMQPPSEERKIAALQEVLALIFQGQPIATSMTNAPVMFLEWLKLLGFNEGSKYLMPGVTAQGLSAMAQQAAAKPQGSPTAPAGESNSAGLRAIA